MDASQFASVLKQTFKVDNSTEKNGKSVEFHLGKVVNVAGKRVRVLRDVDIVNGTQITCLVTNEVSTGGKLEVGSTVLILNGIVIATIERW